MTPQSVEVYFQSQPFDTEPDYMMPFHRAVQLVREGKAQFFKRKTAIVRLDTCRPREQEQISQNVKPRVPTRLTSDESVSMSDKMMVRFMLARNGNKDPRILAIVASWRRVLCGVAAR